MSTHWSSFIRFLLLLVLAFSSRVAQAQEWPRNRRTQRIEFRGFLPWPSSARTAAQRRACARRWYLKIWPSSASRLAAAITQPDYVGKNDNYAHLPNSVLWHFGAEDAGLYILYTVTLQLTPRGLLCIIAHLRWNSKRGLFPHFAGGDLPEVALEQVVGREPNLAYTILTFRDARNLPYWGDGYTDEMEVRPKPTEVTPEQAATYEQMFRSITGSPQQDVLEALRRRLLAAVASW